MYHQQQSRAHSASTTYAQSCHRLIIIAQASYCELLSFERSWGKLSDPVHLLHHAQNLSYMHAFNTRMHRYVSMH